MICKSGGIMDYILLSSVERGLYMGNVNQCFKNISLKIIFRIIFLEE